MATMTKLIIPALAMLALAGCGSSSKTITFPKGHINVADNFYVPVKDKAEAEKLCDAAYKQDQWPYPGQDQVTFDIPNTGSDVTCMKVS